MSLSTKPQVTIGMPVYNGAEYIEQTLARLLQQTHPNFTVMISDNASTDQTWEIVQRWAQRDKRIALHRQKTNIGALNNFRYLLEQADTEYFMWHADDDWVESNYLEALLEVFAGEPACALACPFGIRVAPDGSPIHREAFPALTSKSRSGRIRTLLNKPEGMWIYGLFRTRALRQAWRIAEEYGDRWAFDAVLLLDFILNDQIRGTDRTTFFYRINYASLQSYRPAGHLRMIKFMLRYWGFHLRLWRTSRLSTSEKLLCLPWLINHSIVSLFEHPFKRFFKQPVKKLVTTTLIKPARMLTGRK